MRSVTRTAPVAVALLLAACTGSGSGSGDTHPAPSATFPDRDVSAQYLTAPDPAPIASAAGRVVVVEGGTIAVRLDVLSLTVQGGSTLLRARLSSSSSKQPVGWSLAAHSYQGDRLTGVILVTADQRFRPAGEAIGTARQVRSYPPRCACSPMPRDLGGGGVEVSVQYGALPGGVASVSLRARGFAAVDVPVTRS